MRTLTREDVVELLYEVIDPEININVYDLGMVYDIRIEEKSVELDMTLTSVACLMQEEIETDISESLSRFGYKLNLQWVTFPAWDISKITPDGKEQLAAIGFPMKVFEPTTWVKRTKEDFGE